MIPYGHQEINNEDINEVKKVLKSFFLTQGPTISKFEKAVATYTGASYAVAVNSATSALHLACIALDLGKNDYLWTSPNSFVASANCALYCNANVDFVDIDPKTYNMSIELLEKKLVSAKKSGKLPKIVMPVHFAGQPCDMISIHKLSKRFKFKIIEDASHAIGSTYNKIKVGSCLHSDITVFSFHPVKIITTGEGGIALTNNLKIKNRLSYLRTSGVTKSKSKMQYTPNDEIWNYQQIELGYNNRMTDIQAALGLSQIKRLDNYIKKRHLIAKRYDKAFSKLPIKIPWQSPNIYSSYHLYPICINKTKCRKSQKQLYDFLLKKNIGVNIHYMPIYLHPFYNLKKFSRGYCKQAEDYFKSTISIPIFQGLSLKDQNKVIKLITNFFYNGN